MFLAENSPESVQSNIASWVKFFGYKNPPEWLTYPYVDDWAFAIGAGIAAMSAVAVLWSFVAKRRPPRDRVEDDRSREKSMYAYEVIAERQWMREFVRHWWWRRRPHTARKLRRRGRY
jgi:hypothetical protein